MQPVQPNPKLLGMPQGDVVILSEKLHHITSGGFTLCAQRCITHFAEDSIPYHPGEKACLNRCLTKIYNGMDMAIDIKKNFENQLKAGDMPYGWMRDAAAGKHL